MKHYLTLWKTKTLKTAYHMDALVSPIKVLQFSDTDLERSCRQIFHPDRRRIMLHSPPFMLGRYEDSRKWFELFLQQH